MLPPEIKFYRESDAVNQETTYIFQHALLGTLGRLARLKNLWVNLGLEITPECSLSP